MPKLTARKVETAKPGKYGDGEGLQLAVSASGARKWVLRFQWRGRPREMGLGAFPLVSLEQARDAAREARKLAKAGIDPIADNKREKAVPTFGELADTVAADLSEGFRNEKHKAQWKMTLTVYAKPLRAMSVDAIETADVLAVLKPLWTAKPETASRLRGRIEKVLNAAKAKGFRSGENPAAWRGHLENLLPKQSMLTRGHHAAMPYADVPTFINKLRERDATAALALEFTILTAARTGEALEADWSEFDLDANVWTVPAVRMKPGRVHRVPLSERAVEILRGLEKERVSRFVFPGQKADRPLSGMSMEMVLRRMKVENATVHGFRSSFRDWAGNETPFPRDLAETALSHVIGDKAEQAYRRGDALEKRRALMEAWANYCEPSAASNVIVLKKSG
ncbi:MAG: integrase arm-type DNA-binding domain-containing protein [Rhodoblastus sp.]|nr:integrase arm-type DNA-binding domain-containing protein [Rhodoblastus sp.]